MGFKTGVLIGVLATAVVALGVAVVMLAGDEATTTTATEAEEVADPEEACEFELFGGPVEIELDSSELDCQAAQEIVNEYRESGRNRIGESTAVAGWSCEEFPFADYPLMARCRQADLKFAVVGTAPSAHPGMTAPPGTEPDPTPEVAEPVYFQTPSGNVGCAMYEDGVRCDIREREWAPPPQPSDCNLDWGHAISLDYGGSTFLCAGDTVLSPEGEGAYPVLEYGEAAAEGPFVCESRERALICVAESSHGFRLSAESVKLF